MSREFLRHTVATLAYRAAKAVRDAPPDFASSKAADTTRTPAQILAHLGDLMDWALSMAIGKPKWTNATPLPWDDGVERFFTSLQAFDSYLASDQPLGVTAEKLFQGPVADALTHVGQINILRRVHGAPIRGENYFKADIAAGRVGADQAKPRVEFD